MKLFISTVAALMCLGVGSALAEDRSNANEAQAVRQINDAFYAALNAMFQGELAPMEEVWSHADDVTYLGPDGSFRVGWKATLEDWQQQAAKKLGGKVEPQGIHLVVGQELAVVHNYEVGQNVVDGEATKVRIRATNLFRKENGKWKMIGHHTDKLPFLER